MSIKNNQSAPFLEAWYGRPNGQYLMASLRRALEPVLDLSFGFHILQVAVAPGCELFCDSPINHRIYTCSQGGEGVNLVAHSDELPLESDSVDVVIAHHSLEFGPNPHRVLREMLRVLAPQGHLILIGFNPYSLLGATSFVRRLGRNPLWQAQRPVSKARACDWLHLLGCEVESCQYLYGIPPVGRGRLNQWVARADSWSSQYNLPSGGVYVLHAIKHVSAVNRPKSRLRTRGGRLIGLAVPNPAVASRSSQRSRALLQLVAERRELDG